MQKRFARYSSWLALAAAFPLAGLLCGVNACSTDADQDGFAVSDGDCDDQNASTYPGALETCNQVDDNCSGVVDEGVTYTYYADLDGDTHGSSLSGTQVACQPPEGYVFNSDDCDDGDGAIYPGATERCDARDNDCDSLIDEGAISTWYQDLDLDGYGVASAPTYQGCTPPAGYASATGDCAPQDPTVSPGAKEILGDGIDQNCNGKIDDCSPTLTFSPAWPQEGDQVLGQLACSSGAPLSAYTLSLSQPPTGATWSVSTGAFVWNTDLDDGGSYPLQATIRPTGTSTAPSEPLSTTLYLADAVDNPANIPVDPARYTHEWGLPVFHLFPGGPLTTDYVPATLVFQGITYTDLEMKIHGAASAGYPKNSYTLDFGATNLDAAAYGLPDKDKVVLITTFDDNSYVRQKLAYDIWKDMASWWGTSRLTPRTFFGVVYLNGEYWGLYMAADLPDDQFAKQMGLSKSGNLYKSVNHDANFYLTDASGYTKTSLSQGYEKKEGLPLEGEPDAFADLEALVSFSANATDADFVANAESWLKTDEFMDWFLFVHYLEADDSGGKNAYLYNDPDAPQFRYCPWDFNHALGQSWLTGRIPPTAYNDFMGANGIFAHLERSPTASPLLWSRFAQLTESGPLSLNYLETRLSAYWKAIDGSANRDWSRWGDEYHTFYYWAESRDAAGDWTDYEGEKAYLKNWLEARDQWVVDAHPQLP